MFDRFHSRAILISAALVALLVSLLACSTGPTLTPTPQASPEVVKHYEAGVAFQNAGEWDKAAQEFEAVLKLAGNYKDTSDRYAQVVAKQKEQQAEQTRQAEQGLATSQAATRAAVPTATATRRPSTSTSTPRPTSTATLRPTATSRPTSAPTSLPAPRPAGTFMTVRNTFAESCRLVLWGPADVSIDVGGGQTSTREIKPGAYGWRVFVGGRQTGEAGNWNIVSGANCTLTCDGAAQVIRYGCK